MADDVELMGAALEERVQHCEARLRELSGRMGRHSALMDQQTWAGVQARHAALLRQGGPEVFRCFSYGSLVSLYSQQRITLSKDLKLQVQVTVTTQVLSKQAQKTC